MTIPVTIAWSSDEVSFKLNVEDSRAKLECSGIGSLSLSHQQWAALAQVLQKHLRERKAQRGRNQRIDRAERANPLYGRTWPREDDKKLVDLYRNGTSCADLAETFERSTGAIKARLVHLGVVADRSEVK